VPTLGSTGIEVFPLALGTNTFRWTASDADASKILDDFTAAGGNLVDTADAYSFWVPGSTGGDAETVIGNWLQATGRRQDIILATKVSGLPSRQGLSPGNIRAALGESLARLKTDYVDVYFAHYDDLATPIEDTIRTFAELQASGKFRHVGLSNYTAERIREWLDTAARLGVPAPAVLQPMYNLVARGGFEKNILPIVQANDLGVMPYLGLAAGFLTGKYRAADDAATSQRGQMVEGYLNETGFAALAELDAVAAEAGAPPATVALAWLRVQPGVTAPIASASSPEQLPALLASVSLELSPKQLDRLADATAAFAA
jgi:aryl-alcohol dehydrogenase-like predicted oxidoreductase